MENAITVITGEIQSNEVMLKISACLGKPANDPAVLKFITGAIMTIQKDPKLQRCTTQSIIDSLVQLATTGLSVDNRHLAYLVPYRDNETGTIICTPMPGYQGYLYRIKQAEPTADFTIGIVYKGDVFNCSRANGQAGYTHEIANPFEDDPENIVGAYMYTKTASSSFIEVMSAEELLKVKAQSKMETGAIWKTWTTQMIKKSMARRGGKVNFTAAIADLDAMDNRLFKSIEEPAITEARIVPQRKGPVAKTEHKPEEEKDRQAQLTEAELKAKAAEAKARLHPPATGPAAAPAGGQAPAKTDKQSTAPPKAPQQAQTPPQETTKAPFEATGFVRSISEPNKGGFVKVFLDGELDEDGKEIGFASNDPLMIAAIAEYMNSGTRITLQHTVTQTGRWTNYNIVGLVVVEPAKAQPGD